MPQCYCASATFLRERMWTYGPGLIKSCNAKTYFSGDKMSSSVLRQQLTFRCDWAVSAMRPNSYTANATNGSVTSAPCVSVGSLLHAIAAALSSLRAGPLRHAASHPLLCRRPLSFFTFGVSAAGRRRGRLAVLPFWCCCHFSCSLLCQVECFLNPADLSHISIW